MANLADKLAFLAIAHALNVFLMFLLFFKFWRLLLIELKV